MDQDDVENAVTRYLSLFPHTWPGEFVVAISVILTLIVVGGLVMFIDYEYSTWHCARIGTLTETPTKYDFLTGSCYFQTGAQWVPEDKWRGAIINSTGAQ